MYNTIHIEKIFTATGNDGWAKKLERKKENSGRYVSSIAVRHLSPLISLPRSGLWENNLQTSRWGLGTSRGPWQDEKQETRKMPGLVI
ncbi:hypothetical protein BaRGS_00006502, partial [Batillaria attramentaria]